MAHHTFFLFRKPIFLSIRQQKTRKLIELSDRIEKIYTCTKICVPKSLNICHDPEKLWNSTFINFEEGLNQLTFDPNGSFIEIRPVNVNVAGLKCFTGEPELENLMENGNQITQYVMDHQFSRAFFTKLNFPFFPFNRFHIDFC